MRVIDDAAIILVRDVAKLIEDFLFNTFLSGDRLRQKLQILANGYLSCIQEFFHATHEIYKLFADDFQSDLSTDSSEHFDVAIEELCDFFDAVEGECEVILLYEYVEDVVLVDAEDAAEVGLERERAFDLQSPSCITGGVRYVSRMCSYMKLEYRMQVLVCRLGEVAIIMFSPFLFWSTKLSKRIIINEYTKDRKIYVNYILLPAYFVAPVINLIFVFYLFNDQIPLRNLINLTQKSLIKPKIRNGQSISSSWP